MTWSRRLIIIVKVEKEAGFDVPLLNMRYHLKARKFMKDVKI